MRAKILVRQIIVYNAFKFILRIENKELPESLTKEMVRRANAVTYSLMILKKLIDLKTRTIKTYARMLFTIHSRKSATFV